MSADASCFYTQLCSTVLKLLFRYVNIFAAYCSLQYMNVSGTPFAVRSSLQKRIHRKSVGCLRYEIHVNEKNDFNDSFPALLLTR